MPGDMRLGGGKAPKGGRGTHGQEYGEEGEVVRASEAKLFAGDSERGGDQKDAKVQIAERTLLKRPRTGPIQVQYHVLVGALWSICSGVELTSTIYRVTILDRKNLLLT